MARVTVEDCIDKVDNRFDLVLLAAHRARMISSGSQLTIDRDNDKNPVVSLREIAEQTVSPEDLREELVHSLQKFVEVDEPEPDTVPLIGSAGASVDAAGNVLPGVNIGTYNTAQSDPQHLGLDPTVLKEIQNQPFVVDGPTNIVHLLNLQDDNGKLTAMRGELITDPAIVADLSKRCADSYGAKRAQTMMGLKFRDGVVPAEEDFKEAATRERIAAVRLTPA